MKVSQLGLIKGKCCGERLEGFEYDHHRCQTALEIENDYKNQDPLVDDHDKNQDPLGSHSNDLPPELSVKEELDTKESDLLEKFSVKEEIDIEEVPFEEQISEVFEYYKLKAEMPYDIS